MLRVGHGHSKDALQAVLTHAVGAGELSSFAHRDVVETRQT